MARTSDEISAILRSVNLVVARMRLASLESFEPDDVDVHAVELSDVGPERVVRPPRASFTQRERLEPDDIETVEQIFSEAPVLHGLR